MQKWNSWHDVLTFLSGDRAVGLTPMPHLGRGNPQSRGPTPMLHLGRGYAQSWGFPSHTSSGQGLCIEQAPPCFIWAGAMYRAGASLPCFIWAGGMHVSEGPDGTVKGDPPTPAVATGVWLSVVILEFGLSIYIYRFIKVRNLYFHWNLMIFH